MTRLSVSWPTARRWPRRRRGERSTGLALTSTIRGRPARSTWVRRRRSARVGGSDSIVGLVRTGASASATVEPPERRPPRRRAARRRSPGRRRARRRPRARSARGSPARPPSRRGRGPARRARCAVDVALGADPQERPSAGGLASRLREHRRDRPAAAVADAPARRRIAGRTNSSNVTKLRHRVARQAEQQHRRPTAGPRGARPNANGLPGWTATRHRSTGPTARTRS